MKKAVFVLCWLLPIACALAFYNPFLDGAVSDVRVVVTDECGLVVPEANVVVSFQIDDVNAKSVKGLTNDRGEFATKERNVGSVWIHVRKDGYYDSRVHPNLRKSARKDVDSSRKWSVSQETVQVTLKTIRAPRALVRQGSAYSRIPLPATNRVMGFDLSRFDWCPPYGRGIYDDLQIYYEYWRSPTNRLQVYDKAVVTMTNCVDGFYLAGIDAQSAFRHAYAAMTNAVYAKEFVFEYDRRSGHVRSERRLPKGKYLVFRTRTRLDSDGNVNSAVYGLIDESFLISVNVNLECILNPTPNDPRLEGDWRHELPPPGADD